MNNVMSVWATVLLVLSACGDAEVTGPGGGGTAGAGGTGGAGVLFPEGFLDTTVRRSDGEPLALECLGSFVRPTGDAPRPFTLTATLSTTGEPVVGKELWFYATDDVTPGECGTSCEAATTNTEGEATVQLRPGGFYGFEIPEDEELAHTVPYDALAPSSEEAATFPVIATSRAGYVVLSILGAFGSDPVRPVLAGTVRDCSGGLLENTLVSVVAPSGERLQPRSASPDPSEPGTVYFASGSPPLLDPEIVLGTRDNGRYTVGNLTVESQPYRVEAWGVLDPARGPELLACEEASTLEETIVILTLWPRFGSYPSGHRCAEPSGP
jgi:hypothetical protein